MAPIVQTPDTHDSFGPVPSPCSKSTANAGFLGLTSYSRFLTETQESLGLEEPDPNRSEQVDGFDIDPDRIRRGVYVLELLKDITLYEIFIDRWFSLCQGGCVVIEPIVKKWVASLQRVHGDTIGNGELRQMQQLSGSVWRNTRIALESKYDGKTTAHEFAALSTGHYLRWEVIGIIFAVVGLLTRTLSEWDPIFASLRDRSVGRSSFAAVTSKAAEDCLTFCRELEILGDLLIWLMYENCLLLSALKGDADHTTWQRSGELYNSLVAFGLHQTIQTDERTPFFLAQLRKKVFACAYANDKATATFLGRPPRLSRRYCLLQPPLDLKAEQLTSNGVQLQRALASLDQNGWSTSGSVFRSTWVRMRLENGGIKEDILEISLGTSVEDVRSQAESIQRRMSETHSLLPTSLQTVYENFGRLKRHLPDFLFLMCIRLDILCNRFLLQRVLVKRTGADTRELLDIARQIFTDVLNVVRRRDELQAYQLDFACILSAHGIQSAVVVAFELLKQERSLSRSTNTLILPRSSTIQDLSVFASYLASVDESDGIFPACEQGLQVLRRILDEILSPGSVSRESAVPSVEAEHEIVHVDAVLPGAVDSDTDFMHWMDGIEWENTSWANFG